MRDMNLLCFVGIHDWEQKTKVILGRRELAFGVDECRRCGLWRKGWERPTPLPRDAVRKGGVGTNPVPPGPVPAPPLPPQRDVPA